MSARAAFDAGQCRDPRDLRAMWVVRFAEDRMCPKVVLRAMLAATALALVSGTAVRAQNQDQLLRGQAIVEGQCGRCHATGRTGASAHDRAPPFRSLSARYPLENLAEALAEGIRTGHEEMPEFRFEPAEIEAILGYMASISPPR